MRVGNHTKSQKKAGKYIEAVIFSIIFFGLFIFVALRMGPLNMLNTLFNTAYAILIDTCLYIMALAIVLGALAGLLAEFGVIDLFNLILAPLMRPLYGLPGAASVGIMTTYFSDNAAILTLADNTKFKRFFKKYQMPALTNVGTAFGMGLMVSAYMATHGAQMNINLFPAVLIGNLGAVIGSIVSTRLMLISTKRIYGSQTEALTDDDVEREQEENNYEHSIGLRILNSAIDGGRSGVDVGVGIIAPVVLICSVVLILSNGSFEGKSVFTGAAYEGIGLIPWLAEKIDFILQPLFGFASPAGISVPVTALGSAGAAIALVPQLMQAGTASVHDVAVFTAMCMCWSGYLSTHVSMMKELGYVELTGKAVLFHTIGGICAGVSANILFNLFF